MLGHIVSKEGITIYPEKVKFISHFPFPHNKKAMQYFFGKINFICRFILGFIETIKHVGRMG